MKKAYSAKWLCSSFVVVVLSLFAATELAASDEIFQGEGYWQPEAKKFSSEYQGKYLKPYAADEVRIKEGSGGVAVFTAKPDKGWSVDHWRKSTDSFIMGAEGTRVSGSEDRLVCTQNWERAGTCYIAVKFKYLDYNLSYDGNGVASPAGLRDVSYTNQFALAAAPQAPAGLSFASWRDPSGKEFSAGASVSGASFAMLDDAHVDGTNVTLTAVWATNSYTVTFNPDGGTVDKTSKSVTYGQPYGELPTPAWGEHEFQGWYLGQSQVTAESIVKITADSELKAKWSLKTYTVRFATTGDGEGTVDPVSATASSGQSVAVKATPAENSRFLSWSDGVTDASRTIVVESNATYTANFEMKKYTVTFYWYCADGTPTNESQIVRWGEDAVEPQDIPTRTGYIRQGWEKSFTEVKSNLDIWAHYEALQYTVTFRTDGGTGTGTVNQTSRPWPYGDKFTVAATPATGSEFVKWSDGDVSNPREITVTAPATYTAVFDLIRYDVTFNWRTGDNVATQETRKVEWGTAATPPADSAVDSRVGYSWTGWDVSTNEFLSVASNLTVNATYEAHHYWVHYDVTGGTEDGPDPQEFVYDLPDNLKRYDYKSSEGLTLWGWKCVERDEVYVVPSDAEVLVSNLTAEANGVVTMKAVWDVRELSRAMKCDNLYWKESSDPGWKPGQDFAVWENAEEDAYMFATVQTNGVLSFDWKVEGPLDDQMEIYLNYNKGSDYPLWKGNVPDENWHHKEVTVPLRQTEDDNYGFPLDLRLGLYVPNAQVTAYVRNVTWTPAGGNPDPTPEDAVKISSAEIVNGSFKLSFTSDAKFDYNLLTNANLLIDSWGVMKSESGTGTTITFEPEIQSGVPQMFYKVETIRKK